jgi:hypothetical protein
LCLSNNKRAERVLHKLIKRRHVGFRVAFAGREQQKFISQLGECE